MSKAKPAIPAPPSGRPGGTVQLVRVADGARIERPADELARYGAPVADTSVPAQFVAYPEPPNEYFEKLPPDQPVEFILGEPELTEHEDPAFGSFGSTEVFAPLGSLPAGSIVYLRAGPYRKRRRTPPWHRDTYSVYAPAELFVIAGVAPWVSPGVENHRWAFPVEPYEWRPAWSSKRWEPRKAWPKFRIGSMFPHGPATVATRYRDEVPVVAGMPRHNDKQIVVPLPGWVDAIPLYWPRMVAIGAPVVAQPLDTPGFVIVRGPGGAMPATIWRLGDLSIDPEWHRMRKPGAPVSPKPSRWQPKQGVAAYVPAGEGEDWGPVVVLMPGVKRLDIPARAAVRSELMWQSHPVVFREQDLVSGG